MLLAVVLHWCFWAPQVLLIFLGLHILEKGPPVFTLAVWFFHLVIFTCVFIKQARAPQQSVELLLFFLVTKYHIHLWSHL